VPALTPDKVVEYSALFYRSGRIGANGCLEAQYAKPIFDRAGLPIMVLGGIWNLSDLQNRGALDITEFVIAIHLLVSYKSGAMRGMPNILPPGLYEVAAGRDDCPKRRAVGRSLGEMAH
jgi:epidermal growth factor receptor substrate 15